MPPSSDGVRLDQLRGALRRRIAETSFRAAAREIGMSPSGLHTFLGGTSPHYSTIRKVTAWYVREAQRSPEQATLAALEAAVDLLVGHLPTDVREETTHAILKLIRDASERTATPLPAWLEILRKARAG